MDNSVLHMNIFVLQQIALFFLSSIVIKKILLKMLEQNKTPEKRYRILGKKKRIEQ